jgi:hypothetical protein
LQIKVATANGKATPLACKEAGITEQGYYRRRKEYSRLSRKSFSVSARGTIRCNR